MSNEKLNTGTSEIIQSRLNEQKEDLIQRIQSLNDDRKKVFGGVDFSLIANERISTDQNCTIKDIFSLGKLCLVGHNTHLGLRSEVNLNDVFSAYLLKENRFEPQPIQFIEDQIFIEEFKNLYKYYRNTIFVRFHLTQNYLYFVFQLSNSPSDIKAFKWLIKDNTLTFIDARSASEVKHPNQQEFKWTKATRDMQRKGSHPHVSLADKVFVEAIGGDITIKIEDNTSTGKGIYSEDVIHKDQTLDDAEIHFFDYNNLVIFKIKPYQESERFFIYNHKEKKVARVDSLQYCIILLPENQGVIYPNGYALQTGEIKVIATEDKPVYFNRRIIGVNGENYMFVFYDEEGHDYLLIPYNIIKQTIETPISCNGFTLFDSGKLAYFKSNEETKHHLIQIWQTPFTKEVIIDESLKNNLLYKIGNKDLVRVMAECQELNILLSKKDSYSGLYNDIVKQATIILDSYYFLGEKEIHELNQPLLEIRKIAHAAINEFEKAQEIKNKTAQTIAVLKEKCEHILSETSIIDYQALDQFITVLAEIRVLRGELISAKDLKYADSLVIETLEKQLQERADELSNACVSFLLQDDALLPYQDKVAEINEEISNLKKTIDAKSLEKNIDELALQLELLVDIVNNLKIEDASHSTQIIESISLIFAQINQQRIELNNKKREISGKELSAGFKAQITLFDQAVINFLELANTAEKCEDFLNKLSIQLEEMEAKFVDFDVFIQEINNKREEVYNHFQNKSVQLTEARNKRTTLLLQSAERILKGVKNKAASFETVNEINGYFASDLMIEKIRDIVNQLRDLNDSNKAEEVTTLLKTAQQESVRKLKDKNEIYEDGDSVIAFGDYKFAVNKQKLDLTLVLKDDSYFYHLTGTNFYEKVAFETLEEYKEVWNQEFISENQNVKRFEYMAWELFLLEENIVPDTTNSQRAQEFLTAHFGEGLVKGVHDVDALTLLQHLQQINNELGVLKYTPSERALAQLFWFFLNQEDKEFYEKQFNAVSLLKETFSNTEQFKYLSKRLSEKIEEFNSTFDGFDFVSSFRAAIYLKKENRNAFAISKKAADAYESFLKGLKEKGKDIAFINQVKELYIYPSACYDIVENALKTFFLNENMAYPIECIEEVAAFIITQNYHKNQIINVTSSVEITGLKSLENNLSYTLDYYEFSSRLDYFHTKLKPLFLALQQLKKQWVETKKKQIKLHTFTSQVLTSFVRNKLINDVYFPLIGANLTKQLGAIGNNKRTDRMGMLLLISPPGYGKTTLMEYLADRMGLVFMKINGPSIGHDITSTDPSEAKNAGARQELEKLNLAFEMGDNVMLYLDDIQHCNPEFLQKFISLADGQRKIEGIYNGEAKTYDLRSKRFCLVMAGNPYTESGDKFQIPDMLANRADTYNLGDISGSKSDLFELSLIENALMSNEYMMRLTQPAYQNLYNLYGAVQENNSNFDLEGNFSSQEIEDFKQVLQKIIQVRNTVLKTNALYIKSAAMSDEYRNEPTFKLQGSYRDMNKLVAKIQPILTEKEVAAIVLNHYQNESQTLTTGAESNLLKLKEIMQIQTKAEQKRWEEIKTTFIKNKLIKGVGGEDRMAQIVALLSEFSDGLNGIKDVLKK